MSKKILILTPWLSLHGSVGSFFREQAEIVSAEYEPVFLNFEALGVKAVVKKGYLYKITKEITKEGRVLYTFYYPQSSIFSDRINEILKNISIKRLFRFFDKQNIKVDLIHAHSVININVGYWAYLINKMRKIPYVTTEHGQVSFTNYSIEKFLKIKKVLKNSAYNLSISSDKIRQFAANNIYNDFYFVGNMINPIFTFKEKALNRPFKIITVGAYNPIKDHETMFKALSLIDEKIGKNIVFEWIGCNGWGQNQEENSRNFIKGYAFNNIEVVLSPYLDREEIVERLQNADLFLFSSISEGMPVSVLEALACGTPVVTTNCGGVDQLINDKNGYMVPVKDHVKLAEHAFNIVSNKKVFNHKLISENILKQFGHDVFARKILEVYNSCI